MPENLTPVIEAMLVLYMFAFLKHLKQVGSVVFSYNGVFFNLKYFFFFFNCSFTTPAPSLPSASQSDTEFWDKMQAEWEEMARRNWISENQEAQGQVAVSTIEKVTSIVFNRINCNGKN